MHLQISGRNTFVAAFTLNEVLVVMALSSIVVILTYSVLGMVGGYFEKLSTSSDIHRERIMLRTVIANDIDGADSLKSINNGLRFYIDDRALQWEFGEGEVVRTSKESKSFYPGPAALRLSQVFNHTKNQATDLVNRVTVVFGTGVDSISCKFQKNYPISLQINH